MPPPDPYYYNPPPRSYPHVPDAYEQGGHGHGGGYPTSIIRRPDDDDDYMYPPAPDYDYYHAPRSSRASTHRSYSVGPPRGYGYDDELVYRGDREPRHHRSKHHGRRELSFFLSFFCHKNYVLTFGFGYVDHHHRRYSPRGTSVSPSPHRRRHRLVLPYITLSYPTIPKYEMLTKPEAAAATTTTTTKKAEAEAAKTTTAS